ncbi:MAG TPA: phosphotransferase [Rudaea sp.]|nr:phosphotransferase [Rudaea sp.]
MTIDIGDWRQLIPHAGAMCLLAGVVSFDNTRIHARAVSHRDGENPLRSDGRLRAVHLCEYGAQVMAIHGGLLAQRDGGAARPGMLVSLREVKLHVDRIDDIPGELAIHAEKLLDGGGSWQYAFRVEHARRILAQGRAAVITQSGAN